MISLSPPSISSSASKSIGSVCVLMELVTSSLGKSAQWPLGEARPQRSVTRVVIPREILKTGEFTLKREATCPDRAVSLLADNNLGDAFVR